MALPVTFANLPAGNNPAALLDQEFAAVAAMGTTYCTASGTNNLLLTVAPNQPVPTGYSNGQRFNFIAPANNSGAVTIQVGSLAAIPVHAGGAALSANMFIAGVATEVVISGNGIQADFVAGGSGGGGGGGGGGGTLPPNYTNPPASGGAGDGTMGVVDGGNAAAGHVGEVISATASGVGVVRNTATDIVSIALSAGDWEVWGSAVPSATNNGMQVAIAPGHTVDTTFGEGVSNIQATSVSILQTGAIRVSTASPVTVYLNVTLNY